MSSTTVSTWGPQVGLVQKAGLANTTTAGKPSATTSGMACWYKSASGEEPLVSSAKLATSSMVLFRTRGGRELTYVQYVTDPDPADTTIETIFIYIIKEGGRVEIEQDRHITGLFSLDIWLELLAGAGFEAEARPYPVYDDDGEGYLLVGVLK